MTAGSGEGLILAASQLSAGDTAGTGVPTALAIHSEGVTEGSSSRSVLNVEYFARWALDNLREGAVEGGACSSCLGNENLGNGSFSSARNGIQKSTLNERTCGVVVVFLLDDPDDSHLINVQTQAFIRHSITR